MKHWSDVTMSAMVSQITGIWTVCSVVCSLTLKSKKTSKLGVIGFVRGNHQWPVDFPHKGPITRKMFPFDESSWITLSKWLPYLPRANKSTFPVPSLPWWTPFLSCHILLNFTLTLTAVKHRLDDQVVSFKMVPLISEWISNYTH